MNNGNKKIQYFTDLNAWKVGHQLVLEIYKITNKFPKDELFGLTSQIRRAAVSITSNIAEGFSRQSYKEKVVFYSNALGSATEVQNQLMISKDIGYINDAVFIQLISLTTDVHKLLNGLIKGAKNIIGA